MAADSRYLYHPTQQGAPTTQYYQYQNPPPPPATNYDNSPVQQSARTHIRSIPPPNSPRTEYHAPPPSNSSYPPAHSPYAQGHYMTHGQPAPPPAQHTPPPPPPTLHQPQPQQQAQQQWSSENWPSHYSQHSAYPTQVQPQQQQQSSQPPLPSPVSSVPPESTYASRPDNSPALSSSGYDDRSTSLHHQSTMNGAQPKYRHGREEDSPPNYPNSHSQSSSPNPFATLDFDQLMKHIKFVETPIRERLAGIREPHLETLDQLIHAATYTAQMLDSAAGYTTSPSASNSYHPAPMSTSQSYSNNRLSSPITRESNNRVEDTQSPHMHDNSPPLSASTPSLKRRNTASNTNKYSHHAMDGSQSTHPHAASGSVTTSGSQSQSQPPPPALSQISHSPSSSSLTGTIPPPSQEGGQTCLGCGATSTPEWRRGPMGPRTLCNACGLVYAKLIKKRDRERARSGSKTTQENGSGNGRASSASGAQGNGGSGGGAEDSVSGDSDEDEIEDDYGSGTSGRRSDLGDYRGRE